MALQPAEPPEQPLLPPAASQLTDSQQPGSPGSHAEQLQAPRADAALPVHQYQSAAEGAHQGAAPYHSSMAGLAELTSSSATPADPPGLHTARCLSCCRQPLPPAGVVQYRYDGATGLLVPEGAKASDADSIQAGSRHAVVYIENAVTGRMRTLAGRLHEMHCFDDIQGRD